jgi:hypothetical protein
MTNSWVLDGCVRITGLVNDIQVGRAGSSTLFKKNCEMGSLSFRSSRGGKVGGISRIAQREGDCAVADGLGK